tara:strand:- start:449 stop:700 length:252 start_codon:yes stop_codon:yes gene_type:complete
MTTKISADPKTTVERFNEITCYNEKVYTKDFIEFLLEAGWRLEKKFPSNNNHYSDLLEDTEWINSNTDYTCLKHYRRDLDALS